MWTGDHYSDPNDRNEMLMQNLLNSGALTEMTFSVFMTGTDGNSYMDFGPPNEAAMSDPAELIQFDSLEGDPWWSNHVNGIRFEDGSEYSVQPTTRTITDTGASCIIGPPGELGTIIEKILENVPSKEYNTYLSNYIYDCSDNGLVQDFEIMFNDYWFQVLAEDVSLVVSTDGQWCSPCMSPLDDEWILGDAFLRGWYSVHEHWVDVGAGTEGQRLGFVPHVGSAKSAPVLKTSDPTTPLPENDIFSFNIFDALNITPFDLLIILSILGAFLFCIVFLVIQVCYRLVLAKTANKPSSAQLTKKLSGEADDGSINLIILK